MRTQPEIKATSRRPAGMLRSWEAQYVQARRRKRALAHSVPTVPTAPGNLNASDDGVSIQLSWFDLSSNELGFNLYKRVDAGGYSFFRALGAGVTATSDFAASNGHVYRYYITAFNAVGESGPSNEVVWVFGS